MLRCQSEPLPKQLSSEHYGKITPCKIHSDSRRNKSPEEKQIRLYVGLGFIDGYGKREIGNYLSSLLHIFPRQVDRIDVSEKFSLVSLPPDAARRALEYSRRDKSLPHMHLDQKADKQSGRSGFRKGKEENYKSGRTPRDTDFSHAKEVRQKSRKKTPVHNDKTSNASLYLY